MAYEETPILDQEDLTPDQRPWAYIVAETHPDLWERHVQACARERAAAYQDDEAHGNPSTLRY